MFEFELLYNESCRLQQPAPCVHFKQAPDVGVGQDLYVALFSDDIDKNCFEMFVIGIRVIVVLDECDLDVAERVGGRNGPVLLETLMAFLDDRQEYTPWIEMIEGRPE